MALRLTARSIPPLALLLASCSASADVVATYRGGLGIRVIEASASGWGRVEESAHGEPAELYDLTTPAGRTLRVFRLKGRWVVADGADYRAWLLRNWHPPATTPPEGHFVKVGEEKVGRWTGTAYTMRTGRDDPLRGSCWSWSRFVVMEAPALEPFGNMIRRSILYSLKGQNPPPCYLQAADLMAKGVTLSTDDPPMTLVKLERRKIDPARFRLPSRLLSRAELLAAMDAAYPMPAVLTPTAAPPAPRQPPDAGSARGREADRGHRAPGG